MQGREIRTPLGGRAVLVVTLWVGVVTGLVEAAGSMGLMWFGYLPGVWWDSFWAAPAFDVLLFGATGVGLTAIARMVRRPTLELVLPVYGFLTASIWLGLALPYQVHLAALLVLAAGVGVQSARVARPRIRRLLAFWERTLPFVLGLALAAFVGLQAGRPLWEVVNEGRLPPPDPSAPNVVLIVIDALRADHLTTHGYGRDTSPFLAQLAEGGASFRAAFATSPYTAPSHASLLTGLDPGEHGVQWLDRRPVLADVHPTLAEALSLEGYRTGAISANRFWFTREQRFGRGFIHFEDNYHTLGDALLRTTYGRRLEELVLRRLFEDYPWRRGGHAVTDAAVEWIGEDSERPFFLMVNYFDVHDPYLPPKPFRGLYSSLEEPGGILNSHQGRYHPALTDAELQEEIDAYDGAITYVDAQVRRLTEALVASVGEGDLMLVVTSDHGEAFGEHGAYIHANSLYREEIHVPLQVWAPGRVPEGFVSDHPVSIASIPATILDLVGGSPFGRPSLAPLWEGAATAVADHPLPVSEMEHWPWNLETSPSHYGGIRGVVGPELHYIRNDSLGEELYRWRDDPAERQDLVGSGALADTLALIREAIGRGGR